MEIPFAVDGGKILKSAYYIVCKEIFNLKYDILFFK